MTDSPHVVVTAERTARRTAVATALADTDTWTVDEVAPPSLATECEAADCLVLADDAAMAHVAAAHDSADSSVVRDVTAVVFTDTTPDSVSCRAAGYVRDDGPDAIGRLVDELCWRLGAAADATEPPQADPSLEESHAKIEQLHDVAAEMVACDTEEAVYEVAVRAAEEILDLDIVGIDVVEDGYFVPQALSEEMRSAGYQRLSVEEGIAGKTYRSGETIVVDDVRDHLDANPVGPYQSVLSVPVGDFGLLQAGSASLGAFDARDSELAELLASHAAETVERLRAEAQLRRERDRLSALFENVPDPVVRYAYEDGSLRVQEANSQFERVFGWSTDELQGEDIDEYIVPDGYEAEADDLNEKLMAGESMHVTTKRETSDGVRDILLHVVPFERGERSLHGYAIYTDITTEKQRQRELERQNERLDAFASIVSHDLRNPLSIARGYVDLAEDTGDPEFFEEIRFAHERMNNLIDDLLSLAKQGDVVGESEPVSLQDVVTNAWSGVQTGAATVSVVEETTVVADRERLVELLENLFRNAVEHGSTDHRTTSDDAVEHGVPRASGDAGDAVEHGLLDCEDCLAVTVGATPGGFYVADDGCGIPADERDAVLQSGYTTSEQGTGFGLTIVQEIADAHEWEVAVDESEAGGVKFVFSGCKQSVDADTTV
ncbi:ATP-binding protein [Haloarchaeobius sp. DFWS5]|uniref:ATP-binding protein n=1 Tax=Haloarchaeobius sp. DFWS5 TaxID=3446114 RepID=UPI003EBA0DE0